MKNNYLSGFWGLAVLVMIAMVSFTSTASAQYVGKEVAIERLKTDYSTEGSFKVALPSVGSSRVPSSMSGTEYAVQLRRTYVYTLLEKVLVSSSVGAAIEANENDWIQKLSGQTARASALPVLKDYVKNLLKA
ncbi:MAG: hypothetical protein J5I59_00425 [Saprospiraceae bacterium]|nr:hypothetical protein [Saprospiraceae bacterium]